MASPETFYSEAGDGHVYKTGAVYFTVHDAATGEAAVTVSDYITMRNQWKDTPIYQLHRSFLKFDTSGLPDDCNITGATLSIYGRLDHVLEDDAGHSDGCIYEGTQGVGLTTIDFDAFGAVLLTAGAYSYGYPIVTNDYTAAALNAAGLAIINKTGMTYFCLRTKGDVDRIAPTGKNQMDFWASDKGAGFKPKLVVTYTEAGVVGRSFGYIIG